MSCDLSKKGINRDNSTASAMKHTEMTPHANAARETRRWGCDAAPPPPRRCPAMPSWAQRRIRDAKDHRGLFSLLHLPHFFALVRVGFG